MQLSVGDVTIKLYERENGIQVMACAGKFQQDVTLDVSPVVYIKNKKTGGAMKTKESDTAKLIRSTELQRKSDASCKQVLKSKWILAFILKDIIPEYERCSLEEIVEKYIETDKISEEIPVRDRIEGLDKEDSDMDDATVFFDIRFQALLPDRTRTRIHLYFDVEAQNRYYPGYPLEKRVIYYLARMQSSQLKTISQDTNYAILQKTYSIWICMGTDIPVSSRGTITKYEMEKKDILGNVRVPKEHYDLMSAYILRLGEGDTDQQTMGMLQTLFIDKIPVAEKLERLAGKYKIPMTEEFKEEVADMCSFSAAMEERGMKKGLEQGQEQGRSQMKRELVLEMLKEKESYEKIMKYTKLSYEDIKAIEEEADSSR